MRHRCILGLIMLRAYLMEEGFRRNPFSTLNYRWPNGLGKNGPNQTPLSRHHTSSRWLLDLLPPLLPRLTGASPLPPIRSAVLHRHRWPTARAISSPTPSHTSSPPHPLSSSRAREPRLSLSGRRSFVAAGLLRPATARFFLF